MKTSFLVNLSLVLLLALIVFVTTTHGAGKNFFVDKYSKGGTCSDKNKGSIYKPFCTIKKALKAAKSGDTIYFREGTYPPFEVTKSGEAGRPITFSSYNGEKVVIDTSTGQDGIYLYNKQFIILNGFEVINASGDYQAGIHLYGGGNNTIKNNLVHDNNSPGWVFGILVSNSGGNTVSENQVYNNYSGGIRFDAVSGPEVLGNKIINNHTHHNTGNSGNADGIQLASENVKDTLIKDNIVHDNDDDGIDTWISSNNTVLGNTVYNQKGSGDGNGFKMGGQTTGGSNLVVHNFSFGNKANGFDSNGSGGNKYYHNVAYGNGEMGFEDGYRNPGSLGCPGGQQCQSSFINNIGYNNKRANFSSGESTKVADYNLWFDDTSGAGAMYNYTEYSSLPSFTEASNLDRNSLSQDPGFVSPNAGDFHLQPASAAIDKGDPANPAQMTWCGGGVDIGKFEECP